MLLAHARSIVFDGTGISIEGLEDYGDNEPYTDLSDDPFSDDEDDAAV